MSNQLYEEVTQSEIAYHGRLLTIRVDHSRLSNGVECTREVIVHPGAVAMVPLLDADHILMVRQWRAAAACELLEIPAGTLNPGEAPLTCAERELMEEVGYRPRNLTPLCSAYLAPGYSSELLHTFLAEDLVPEKLAEDEDENIEVVTITWDDIEMLLQQGKIADAKSISGLLLAQKLIRNR